MRGSTDDSYGIEVAKLAGLPSEVIKRARDILVAVEKSSGELTTSTAKKDNVQDKDDSLISFDDCIQDQVIEELKAVDINTLSPYEAMTFLYTLQKRLK